MNAINSHDITRGRGSLSDALSRVKARTLVAGINSDRLFPITGQAEIAANLKCELIDGGLQTIDSEFGHDGFLIEKQIVGPMLRKLLS